jgi:hypothetical protein
MLFSFSSQPFRFAKLESQDPVDCGVKTMRILPEDQSIPNIPDRRTVAKSNSPACLVARDYRPTPALILKKWPLAWDRYTIKNEMCIFDVGLLRRREPWRVIEDFVFLFLQNSFSQCFLSGKIHGNY